MISSIMSTHPLSKFLHIIHHVSRKHLVAIFLCMCVATALDTVGIGITVPLVSTLMSPGFVSRYLAPAFHLFQGVFFQGSSFQIFVCGLIVAVFTLKAIATTISQWLLYRYMYRLRVTLSAALFKRYIQLPYIAFLEKNSAVLLTVCFYHAQVFTTNVLQHSIILLSEFSVLVSIVALLMFFSPLMTGIVIVALTFVTGLYLGVVRNLLYRLGVDFAQASNQSNRWMGQVFSAFKDIRVTGTSAFFYNKVQNWLEKLEKSGVRSSFIQNCPKPFFELVFVSGLCLFCVSMVLLHWPANKMILTLTLFGASVFRLFPAFNRMTYAYSSIKNYQASIEILYTELTDVPPLFSPPASAMPIVFSREISVQNLSFHYPATDRVGLTDVSLHILKGQKVGIVGKSGSGKSTLVDFMLGLLSPYEGQLLVDGQAISPSDLHWTSQIGYCPQSVALLDDTIRHNVAFGVSDIDETRLTHVLRDAQLYEFAHSLPQGLDTMIGENGVKLSGGQRQRLGIARALYHDPPILVFDEATSALDVETEQLISEQIHRIGEGKTVIIIAHRLSTIQECDTLILLQDGRVVGTGNYANLVDQNDWFRQIQ